MSNITEINQQIIETQAKLNNLKRERYLVTKGVLAGTEDKAAARKAKLAARYITNNGLTIHKLRLAGNDVMVSHIRFTEVPGNTVTHENGELVKQPFTVLQPVPSNLRKFYDFTAKGGATHIVITKRDGSQVAVASYCHELDGFDYKLGVKLALDCFSIEDAHQLLTPAAVPTQESQPALAAN